MKKEITINFEEIAFPFLEDIFGDRNQNGNFSNFPVKIDENIQELKIKSWYLMHLFKTIKKYHKNEEGINTKLNTYKEKIRKFDFDLKEVDLSVEIQDYWLLLEIETLLHQVKAFLDILAQTIIEKFEIQTSLKTFSRKNKHIGEKFLLEVENKPSLLTEKEKNDILDLFKKHKKEWIDQTVIERDTVTHYRSLKGKVSNKSKLKNTKDALDNFEIIYYWYDKSLEDVLSLLENGFKNLLENCMSLLK